MYVCEEKVPRPPIRVQDNAEYRVGRRKVNPTMSALHAVIMAGGAGTRFWPKSRSSTPKQLLALRSERSLLQETVDRLRGYVEPAAIWIITGSDQHTATVASLPELPPENIVAEPARRDTAPCVGLAATLIAHRDPDATMIVLPADHIIGPDENFHATLATAVQAATDGSLVTIGIKPDFPATGYGYIERGERGEGDGDWFRVARFVEKPDESTATAYLETGRYYWNSGIFVFSVSSILGEMREHLPGNAERLARIGAALDGADAAAVLEREFCEMERISIDYGVFEKAQKIAVVEAGFDWDDVGSWAALARHREPTAEGHIAHGRQVSVDAENCIVWADDPDHLIGLIGVKDLIVVSTPDATLVCPREMAEQVKALVQRCREGGLEKWLD